MLLYNAILVIAAFYLMIGIDGINKSILALSTSQNYTNGLDNNTLSSSSLSEEDTHKEIINELRKIKDPELGVSIIVLELIDSVTVNEGNVTIDFHATSPFEPAKFIFRTAEEIRDSISSLPQVHDVRVNLSNHFMAETTNQQVNQPKPTEESRLNSSIALEQYPNSTQSDSQFLADNVTNKVMVEEKLRNATPGEILKLNLDNYPTTLYLEALENLSPQELATALSKISSAYSVIRLTNATSQELAQLLIKLSPEDLGIAFTYQLPGLYSIIEKLDRSDLSAILTNLSSYELLKALSNLESGDEERALRSLSPGNLTRLINELPPNLISEELGDSFMFDALSYSEKINTLSKQSPENLTIALEDLDSNTIKDVLDSMTPLQSGFVLNMLAGNSSGRFGEMDSGDFATMLKGILNKASLDQINQIPFTKYSIDVIAYALTGLPQEKQEATLAKFPEDKRNSILLQNDQ